MLQTIEEVFATGKISKSIDELVEIRHHTPKQQGLFLQKIFDKVKPKKSLEIGMAYGISTLFILEKHREYNNKPGCHIAIEPDTYWGAAAEFNIKKEGLLPYLEIIREYSHDILPRLYYQKRRIQYCYIDTTKQFDTVLQDFFFIDKIMDVGGAVIFDDCGGGWPGIQRVARFVNSLPHYTLIEGHQISETTVPLRIAMTIAETFIKLIPFKKRLYPTTNFKSERQLGLNYQCLAFQKTAEDSRNYDWDASI